MTMDSRENLDARIDAIESAYEYFLAYAAQGRVTDRETKTGQSSVRDHLEKMEQALDGLGRVARACADAQAAELATRCEAFFAAIDDDSAKAQGAIRLVAAQADVSSQLIDNLNASIHVRALLTDLFVVDEALKSRK